MKFLLLILSLQVSLLEYSQEHKDSLVIEERTDTLFYVVHFDKDIAELNNSEKDRLLKEFLIKYKQYRIQGLELSGHTDSDGDNAYNDNLSNRRVESVTKEIANFSPDVAISSKAFGESQLLEEEITKSNKASNRRVEIKLIYSYDHEYWVPCRTLSRHCNDTFLILATGTMIETNTCEIERLRECSKFTELVTIDQIRENDQHTMDENGNQLMSGGMLEYEFCDSIPRRVLIPVNENCYTPGMRRYDNVDGEWQLVQNEQVEVVTINGLRYYSMTVSRVGRVNVDMVLTFPPSVPKIVIRSKRGVRMRQVNYTCDCPMMNQEKSSAYKKKIKLTRVCCTDPQIKIEAKDKEGNVRILDWTDINTLKGNPSLIGCESGERRKILGLNFRKKRIYRRYRLYPKHFNE